MAGEEDEEFVPVVALTDFDEDTSAWDLPAAGGLLALGALAGRRGESREQEPETPDYTQREMTPWEYGGVTASASAPLAAPAAPRSPVDLTHLRPRPFRAEDRDTCGSWGSAEQEEEFLRNRMGDPEAEQDQEEGEEEEERTSADLLKQDADVWSVRKPNSPGVLG
ncbi:hypothetical protein CFN78_23205 [Amycolatopsis antarctica]|uniref:Uncharacterized protein n=2 Tax=Amycolatopsis antarctica TaxID=1854586 RepID=A0A263CXF3_9PSEU|nr:hypothetical protein CFN78_23205 [Amycolatopsis antarctica]